MHTDPGPVEGGNSNAFALPTTVVVTLLALAVALGLAPDVWAANAPIIVTTALDDFSAGDTGCSLREAIQAANLQASFAGCAAGSGTNTISLPARHYVLSIAPSGSDDNQSGDLNVASNLKIVGTGARATIIDANKIDRVLSVDPSAPSHAVEIDKVTITGGLTPNGPKGQDVTDSGIARGGAGTNAADGGGILNSGTLTLASSIVSGNYTGNGGAGGNGFGNAGTGGSGGSSGTGGSGGYGGDGAGISSVGRLTIKRSAITGNVTGDGGRGGGGYGGGGDTGAGGGYGSGGGGGYGGNGGGIDSSAPTTVIDSTISHNRTGAGGFAGLGHGGYGGGGTSGGGKGGAGGAGYAGGAGAGGLCAGLCVFAAADIRRSTIDHNTTGAGGDGNVGVGGSGGFGGSGGGDGGNGGAAYGGHGGQGGYTAGLFTNGGMSAVKNSTVNANATGAGGAGGGANGGAAGLGNGGATGTGGNANGGDAGYGGPAGGITVQTASLSLVHDTITGNQTGAGGLPSENLFPASPGGSATVGSAGSAGSPGGIYSGYEGTSTLRNTIVAGNAAPNCRTSGTFSSFVAGGHNITFPDKSCPGSNLDPKLGPLADYGGPTKSQALKPGSPAINKVPVLGANCAPTDQRGVHRPRGFACDIGAFEFTRPKVVIKRPVNGNGYRLGKQVTAAFSCSEGGVRSVIRSCVGTVPNGHRIDTATAGRKGFTVTAKDKAGNRVTKTVHYTVKKP